jgi:hypothetical protein
MTTETITTTDETQNGNNKPDFYAKVRQESQLRADRRSLED